MPGMTGIAVIAKLRDFIEELNFKQAKIEVLEPELILVTAYVTQELRDKLKNSAWVYEKPLQLETLEALVIDALN